MEIFTTILSEAIKWFGTAVEVLLAIFLAASVIFGTGYGIVSLFHKGD